MGQLKTLTVNGRTYDVVSVVPAASVTLRANSWSGSGTSYSQVVAISGVTASTKVDLQPTAAQLAEFHHNVLALVAENDGGTVTVYAIGDKPMNDYTIQITKTEVGGVGKIRGNTVGTTMPRTDFNQTDSSKADYLLGRETIVRTVNGTAPDENGDVEITIPDSSQNVDLTGYATEEFVKNKIAEAELGGKDVDLSGYAQKSELPTKVSQLENDSGYLTEHQDISGKLDTSELPAAIDTALAQAKASGEFDGKDGASSWNDLTDKPFGEVNVDLFDVAEETESVSELDPSGSGRYLVGCAFFTTPEICSLEVGKEYTVTLNGHTYTDIAKVDDSELLCVGDSEAFANQDWENFRYYIRYEGPYSNGHCTFDAIHRGTETELTECVISQGVTKLDEKYIPDTIAKVSDVERMIAEMLGAIPDASEVAY